MLALGASPRRAHSSIGRAVLAAAVLGAVVLGCWASPASAHTPHDVAESTAFSPDFASDRTVYTVVREMLLKSTDGGETWSRLVKGLDNRTMMSSVAVDPSDASHVYVATRGNGLYESTNAGASWASTGGLTPASRSLLHIEVSPKDGATLFGLNPKGGVVTSTDGGKAWKVVQPLAKTKGSSLRIADDDKGTILVGTKGRLVVSTDGGKTWTRHDVGVDDDVSAIAPSPHLDEDHTILLGMSKKGVRRTTDGGKTFEDTSSGLKDKRILDVAIAPDAPDASTAFASSWQDGVFRTTDGGDRWTRMSSNLTTNEQADLLKRSQFTDIVISPDVDGDHRVMFVDGFDGLFRSEDDAKTWHEVTTQDSTNIAGFAISPDYQHDGTLAVVTYINGALRSTDRGDSWTSINRGLAAEFEWLRRDDYVNRLTAITFSPLFAKDKTLYAGDRGYWYTSADSGDVWHASTPEGLLIPGEFPPGYLIPAFSPDYAKDRTVFAGTSTGLMFRTDEAGQWVRRQRIPAVVTAMAVSPAYSKDKTVLAATSTGVYRSTDRGKTYRLVKTSPPATLNIAVSSGFGTDGRAWVGTKSGLFTTTDHGATWSRVTKGLPFGGRAYIEAFVTSPTFADDGVALVSVRSKGLYRSTDGAKTFQPVASDLIDNNIQLASWYHPTSSPIQFSPSFSTDRTVFAISGSTLYRSTDVGSTWTPLDLPRFTHPVTEASAPNTLIKTPRPAATTSTKGNGSSRTGPAGAVVDPRAVTDHPLLIVTAKRLLAAILVGVLALVAMVVLKIGSRTSRRRLELSMRLAWGLVAFGVAFLVLTSR